MALIRLGHIMPKLMAGGQEFSVVNDVAYVPDELVGEVLATHPGSIQLAEPQPEVVAEDVNKAVDQDEAEVKGEK